MITALTAAEISGVPKKQKVKKLRTPTVWVISCTVASHIGTTFSLKTGNM